MLDPETERKKQWQQLSTLFLYYEQGAQGKNREGKNGETNNWISSGGCGSSSLCPDLFAFLSCGFHMLLPFTTASNNWRKRERPQENKTTLHYIPVKLGKLVSNGKRERES